MFYWNPLEDSIQMIPVEISHLSHRDQIRWSRWYIHLQHLNHAENLIDMICFKRKYGVVYEEAQEIQIQRSIQSIRITPLELTSVPTLLGRKDQLLQIHQPSKIRHSEKQSSRDRLRPSVK
jgi:hypothetical protein